MLVFAGSIYQANSFGSIFVLYNHLLRVDPQPKKQDHLQLHVAAGVESGYGETDPAGCFGQAGHGGGHHHVCHSEPVKHRHIGVVFPHHRRYRIPGYWFGW